MRNRNIFIRKETAFSCANNNPPVFALVKDFVDGNVYYVIDYLEQGRTRKWHYADNDRRSGTYIVPLDAFLSRFMPDFSDEYRLNCAA